MHHSHVYEDFLLMYILFARTHEHEGTFPIFTPFAMMHIAKIHVTHCLLCHAYAFTCSYISYLHDCIHVGEPMHVTCLSKALLVTLHIFYLKLWCMLSPITKKGEIESTSAPWVILVINVNISLVGLMFSSSIFQTSSTNGVAWTRGCGTPSRCYGQKTGKSSKAQDSTFHFSDPRSHWVHRKANTIKRGWGVA